MGMVINLIFEKKMLIFLARIPKETTPSDIIDFLNPVLKGGFFMRKGIIHSLEIMIYPNSDAKTAPHYGLVRIEPNSVARRVIHKLNRKPLNGKLINVREYYYRDWHNDPRIIHKSLYTKMFQNRRQGERRHHQLQELMPHNERDVDT
jgi:hypothetical protein